MLFWLCCGSAVGQTGLANHDTAIVARNRLATASDTLRPQPRFTGAPLFFVQPETGFAFGAGGVWFHRPRKMVQPGKSLSTMTAAVIYTVRGQFVGEVRGQLFTDADRWRLNYHMGYYDYPYFFYGIGNDNPDDAEETYTNRFPLLDLTGLRAVRGNVYAGLGVFLEHNRFSEFDSSGLLISGGIPGTAGGLNWGFGPRLLYDSRDNVNSAYRGWYVYGAGTFHSQALGAVQNYSNWELDVRTFLNLSRREPVIDVLQKDVPALLAPRSPNHILAVQLYGNWVAGAPPFHRLALFGGPDQMRGFLQGQDRDQLYLTAQTEYRFPIWRFLSGAAFVSAGQVQPSWQALNLADLAYSGGAGLHLQLSPKERTLIRLDYAYSSSGSDGFYLQFRESF
jgi:outer membrane protein assembly factor BamA